MTPEVYSYKDVQTVVPMGEAIVSFGLEVRHGVSGFGLLSRGLLWEYFNTWIDTEFIAPITTLWSSSETSITTNWTDADASVTTAWTDSYFGEPFY